MRVFDNLAVVVCLENIETLVNGEIVRLGVIATNIFEQMENQWLLIHHHGSSVSNSYHQIFLLNILIMTFTEPMIAIFDPSVCNSPLSIPSDRTIFFMVFLLL